MLYELSRLFQEANSNESLVFVPEIHTCASTPESEELEQANKGCLIGLQIERQGRRLFRFPVWRHKFSQKLDAIVRDQPADRPSDLIESKPRRPRKRLAG